MAPRTSPLRPLLVSAVLVAFGAVVGATMSGSAHATGTKVVCTQVLQGVNGRQVTDEVFVANFMSEQLAQGREHFESIHGLSTLVCAW